MVCCERWLSPVCRTDLFPPTQTQAFADMSISPAIMRERMPVWDAMSEFFLDTELQEQDLGRIAGVLARSPYSERELWDILRHEVYPPCHWNLLCSTGEWALFGEEFLLEKVAPRCGKRPKFAWPVLHAWMFRDHWNKVRVLLQELRARSCGERLIRGTNGQFRRFGA